MEISSSRLSFRVSLIELDELKPHEEIIHNVVRDLADEISREKEVRDPLIVDGEELVILDGMHRYNALKLLKCQYAPCCLVNYDSPLIRVGAWFRLYEMAEPNSIAARILRENALPYSEAKVTDFNPRERAMMLTKDGTQFVLKDSMPAIDLARTAVKLEKTLLDDRHRADYLSELVSLDRLKEGQVDLIITLPVFTKKQIREYGLQGSLLPHKVTRHVIPSRPLRLNVPLKMLNLMGVTRGEADRRLGEMLAKRHVEQLPPGSVVDGRRYEEELLVFGS